MLVQLGLRLVELFKNDAAQVGRGGHRCSCLRAGRPDIKQSGELHNDVPLLGCANLEL
jgi:hypothetical protein